MDHGLHRLAVLVSIRIWLSCRKNDLEMGVWHRVFVFPDCRFPHYLFYGRDVRLHSPSSLPCLFQFMNLGCMIEPSNPSLRPLLGDWEIELRLSLVWQAQRCQNIACRGQTRSSPLSMWCGGHICWWFLSSRWAHAMCTSYMSDIWCLSQAMLFGFGIGINVNSPPSVFGPLTYRYHLLRWPT